jgi:hypothetical protein
LQACAEVDERCTVVPSWGHVGELDASGAEDTVGMLEEVEVDDAFADSDTIVVGIEEHIEASVQSYGEGNSLDMRAEVSCLEVSESKAYHVFSEEEAWVFGHTAACRTEGGSWCLADWQPAPSSQGRLHL